MYLLLFLHHFTYISQYSSFKLSLKLKYLNIEGIRLHVAVSPQWENTVKYCQNVKVFVSLLKIWRWLDSIWFCSIFCGVYVPLTEAVDWRCSVKKVFLEIDLRPATLLKKRLWHRCFLVNFAKFLRIPFVTEHLWWLLLHLLISQNQWNIPSTIYAFMIKHDNQNRVTDY